MRLRTPGRMAHQLGAIILTLSATPLPSVAHAQAQDPPVGVSAATTVDLRLGEPIRVRRGFEHLEGRAGGWAGDSLVLLFAIGKPLLLPMDEVGEIAARRRTADRAIAAGLLFGAVAWLAFQMDLASGVLVTQCDDCARGANVWRKTGGVVLLTTSAVLIADFVRPPYTVVYRRPSR